MAGASNSAVKFVGSDADGLPLKRKQVQQACLSCRKRKKRCTHTLSSITGKSKELTRRLSESSRRSSFPRRNGDPAHDGGGERGEEDSCQVAATQLVELSSRFVGDLNPEGLLLEATTPMSPKKDNVIGIWLPPRPESASRAGVRSPEEAAHRGSGKGSHGGDHATEEQSSSLSQISLAYERAKARYLNEECLAKLPLKADFLALRRIFLEKVHPIFPIFTDSDLAGANPDPVYGNVVKQVVSLAGGMDPEGRKHLRLRGACTLLSPQDFHQQMSSAIFPILEAGWIQNKADQVRVYTIMALFYQPFSASERDRAGFLISQAVHHLQSLGGHLQGYRCVRADEDFEKVFCAVWAVDRLTASLYARPCVMHERDVERNIDSEIDKQPPCFRLFLKVIQTLDRVLTLYRPRQPYVYTDVPVFESLIIDTGTGRTPTKLLATLETLYHAVAVLSCRRGRVIRSAAASADDDCDHSHLPDSVINPRLSLSADRIVWAVRNEELCPFPFVPYGVSLALSVQYRKMRYSKTLMFRNRARGIFAEIVRELHRLGNVFSSASVNAGLGESILREMEKTATNLCRDEQHHLQQQQQLQPQEQEQEQLADVTGSSSVDMAAGGDAPKGLGVQGAVLSVHEDQAMAGLTGRHRNSIGPPASPFVDAARTLDAARPLNDFSSTVMTTIEPSVFDNLDGDVDLFGYLDPDFDFGAVDSALEANLNMGFPQTWTEQTWNLAGG